MGLPVKGLRLAFVLDIVLTLRSEQLRANLKCYVKVNYVPEY